MAKKEKWYRFTFEDGYYCEARGLDKLELEAEKKRHGRLISKDLVAW